MDNIESIYRDETFGEKVKRKVWEVKHDATIAARRAYNWGMQNKEFVVIAAPLVLKGLGKAYKLASKTKEQRYIDEQRYRFWDPRMGRFAYSRRKLTKQEEDYIERQYKAGRSYRDILGEMGVLR